MRKSPRTDRDISWLRFNFRVLQEAMNPDVPLLERVKFLAIYSSNLDEFYSIRVANARNLLKVNKKTIKELDFDPKLLLKQIKNIVAGHHKIFSRVKNQEIIPALREHGIFLLKSEELNESQQIFVDNYFSTQLVSFVQPVLLDRNLVQPFLNDAALYLSIQLKEKQHKNETNSQYAIVKIPSDFLPRFIELPSAPGRHDVILLDDVVRHTLPYLFPGFSIIGSFSMKITRDAELYIEDEYSGDLLVKIKNSLLKRNIGPASRFVYDRSMPQKMLDYMTNLFGIAPDDIIQEGRVHNNFDFFQFPTFGKTELLYPKLQPLENKELLAGDIFKALKNSDHLLYFPFHSYEPVVKFFEEASKDPDVTHIKVTQYRVAKESRIMEALIAAVQNGKSVTVFIEVKARFDEEANLNWGEKLEKSGVKVHYSFPGLKVHSKLALIRRMNGKEPELFSYMSTGNFHEGTAKLYCDFGYFTSNPNINIEVAKVFSFLETVDVPDNMFENLLVGQFNLRKTLVSYLNRAIELAKEGKKPKVILKMNSLEDDQMIEKLYEASNAGVKIQLIIRGINCLVPRVPKFSNNIAGISIVDRYLEHTRVFVFHLDADPVVILSSADWMSRNLSYRIETAFHILEPKIKKIILDILDFQLRDNVKARILDGLTDQSFKSNNEISLQSQNAIYEYLKTI